MPLTKVHTEILQTPANVNLGVSTIGSYGFNFTNSTSTKYTSAGRLEANVLDNTDSSEDVELNFYPQVSGNNAFTRAIGIHNGVIIDDGLTTPTTLTYQGIGKLNTRGYFVNNVQVLGTKITGWGTPTGTATRTGFSTASVTVETLAEHVKAVIDDLKTHGIIGT